MFGRITVALDGSAHADRAAELAFRLARHFESRLTAIFVADVRVLEGPTVDTLAPLWGEVTSRPFRPEVLRAFRERGSEVLERFARRAREHGCSAPETRVEIGLADEVLLERAAEADLLAIGRRGEHAGFGERALGGTADALLHGAPGPVLVAEGADRPAREQLPRACVVAYDASDASARALELACRYAGAVEGSLRVVHAGDESGEDVLERARETLRAAGVEGEAHRVEGDPAEAVEEALERWSVDCLFMGAFGRGRLRGFLFGSHTRALFERAAVPVFVTR